MAWKTHPEQSPLGGHVCAATEVELHGKRRSAFNILSELPGSAYNARIALEARGI